MVLIAVSTASGRRRSRWPILGLVRHELFFPRELIDPGCWLRGEADGSEENRIAAVGNIASARRRKAREQAGRWGAGLGE